ncbi:MAG: hydroxymethylglutaryl-CoA reductase [Clostridiales bacterium]|jgi:hydroxymethylglutaryl-CoA reductase|nr:hydroxymethylglutaryl-CoA reductase [Clostridiales bacterium]MDN5299130.1 hydroxymethylglutaryl-CoA reductase [Clostridiales bacterium]
MKSSLFSGFYKLTPEERLKEVVEFSGLSEEDVAVLRTPSVLGIDVADRMVENAISTLSIPFGVGMNFLINGKDYIIPMATEEPSVIAAASNMARICRKKGGFFTSNTGPTMIAQIQIVGVQDVYATRLKIFEAREALIAIANEQDPFLISLGGGMKDLEVRIIDSQIGPMVIVHIIVDTKDAMGANTVNTMAEALAPKIESLTGGKVYLRILSNLADKRLVRVRTVADKEAIGGEHVVDGIVSAYAFAAADPYRAATHNKGIMNGISAVVLATGNDTRAVESGAHAYAARNGVYTSLTHWEKTAEGDLAGSIEIPMAVGLVGGATKVHPTAKIAVKMLGVQSAVELGEIIAAAGLSQNLAALRALATEGIQRGHMSLHSRNIAVMAGAPPELVDAVVKQMIAEGKVRMDRAKEIIETLTNQKH